MGVQLNFPVGLPSGVYEGCSVGTFPLCGLSVNLASQQETC